MYTLLRPFNGSVWISLCVMMFVQTSYLVMIRKILSYTTSTWRFRKNYFRGILINYYVGTMFRLIFKSIFLDIALPLILLTEETLPDSWFEKQKFSSHTALLGQWMLLLMFLSQGYKCILLSTLVPIQYSKVMLALIISLRVWEYLRLIFEETSKSCMCCYPTFILDNRYSRRLG